MQKQSKTNQQRCPQQTFLSTLSYTRTSKQHFTKLKSCSAFSVGRTPSSQHALLNQPAFTDSLISSSPFHCLCARVHALGHAYVCEHVRTQCTLRGHKITSGVSAQAPSTFYLRQGLSGLELWYIGRLAGQQAFRDPPVSLHLAVLGLQAYTTFIWVLEAWTQVPLMLARQGLHQLSLLLSHCPLQLGTCLPGGHYHTALPLSVNLPLSPSRLDSQRPQCRTVKMAQWVKTLVTQAWQPESDFQNP